MPDPSFIIPLFLQSALLPFMAALILYALLRGKAAATVFAAAGGFLASYIAVFHAQWSLPPKQALDWLPWILLPAGGLAMLADRLQSLPRHAIRLAAAVGTAWIVAWPAVASGAVSNPATPVAVAGFAIFAAWSYLARAAHSRATPAILLAIVAGGAALTMMLDVSALLGQLTGGVASALLGCIAFGIIRRRMAFSGAATGVTVLLLGTLLFNAYLYAEFPLHYIALLTCGLLADGVSEVLDRVRRSSAGIGSLVTAGMLAVIPVAVVIGLAVKAAQESGGY